MSNLLDKFKKPEGSVTGRANTTEGTVTEQPKPAPTEPAPSKFESRLAGLQRFNKSTSLTPEQQEAKKKAEADKLTKAKSEVPEGIYTLNPAIHNIEGLDAEAFANTLASTAQALIDDEPLLASLMERIGINLRQYEELSYLLSEDQLSMYFDGLMKLTATNIKTTKPKTNSATLIQQIEKEGGSDTLDFSL